MISIEHIADVIVFALMYWLGYRSGWHNCAQAIAERATPIFDRIDKLLANKLPNRGT